MKVKAAEDVLGNSFELTFEEGCLFAGDTALDSEGTDADGYGETNPKMRPIGVSVHPVV